MTPSKKNITTPQESMYRTRKHFMAVWTIVGVLLLLAALVYLLNIMSLPVSVALWTLVFVFCLSGVVDWFEKKGVSRLIGTAFSYVLMVAVILIVGFVMFSPAMGMSSQFAELIKSMPTYLNNFTTWASSIYDRFSVVLQDDTLKAWVGDMAGAIASAVTSIFEGGASGIVAIGSSLVNGVIAICFAVVIAFWLLMELPAIDREARRLVGPTHRESYDLISITVTRVMGGFIRATVLQCLIIGVGCGVLYIVLGLPSAVALAGIAAVMNVVPVIGQWIAIVIVSIVGLTVSPVTALIIIVGMICIQQFVYTFVQPKLMMSSVDVHPVLTLIVLVIGSALGSAMGGVGGAIVGMLLAIPAVAVMKSVFVYYFEKNTGRQLVAYDGVFFQGTPSSEDEVDPLADALSPADYEKEAQLLEQERIERTGRIEPVSAPKLDLPFVKRLRTDQLPVITPEEVAEEVNASQDAKKAAQDARKVDEQ